MIVIPMAGLSKRFREANYSKPKFMLEAHGKTLFTWAVNSFKNYFRKEFFLFIVLKDHDYELFIEKEIALLGIENYHIASIEPSEGQAHTVYLGLQILFDFNNLFSANKYTEKLIIFNIDTFRPDFKFSDSINSWDGYLEVFKGSGDNWSYVKPITDASTEVEIVAEKKVISNLCCTGLYYFAKCIDFINAFEKDSIRSVEMLEGKERYIAPLYNYLIKGGKQIHYHLIDRSQVIFCGIPDEYEEFLKNDISSL